MKAASIAEEVRSRYLKRSVLFHRFEEQLAKLRATRDLSAFQAAAKNILAELKVGHAGLMADSAANLRADHPQLADKIAELQRLDK